MIENLLKMNKTKKS